MCNRLIVIFILLQIFTAEAFSQVPDNDNRLRTIINAKGQATVSILRPGAKEIAILSKSISINSATDKNIEIVLSPITAEWFISRKYDYEILENDDIKGIITASTMEEAKGWDIYPTYTQYESIMQSFATLYPTLCDIDTIGTSINGKLVLVIRISNNPLAEEDEPEVFYSSTIHGDETGGYILMLRLAEYLLMNYNSSSRIKNLVDNLEIWINPLANPDGTYGSGDFVTSPTRGNANGVDLNRNFPDPNFPGAVQQKENIDMVRFMREHKFVISANFHAGVEVVNYPWDRWMRFHPDDDWLYHISRRYADIVHLYAVPGYMTFKDNGITNGYDWYPITGGRQDFVTWELHGREVTIELDDTKLTPAANLNSLWEYNYRSLLDYIENALYGIHGKVTDFVSGEPVAAKIFIAGHDADSSHVYSDTLFGSFIRLIAPGTWTLTFTADGYISKSVSVTVANELVTLLDVEMVPLVNPVDSIKTQELRIYPNPADDFLRVVLPDRQIGEVELMIINSLGVKVFEYEDMSTFEDVPVVINLQELPVGVYSVVIRNSVTKVTDKAPFIIMRRK